LPAVEWLRLWAGFSLPWLLIGHVVATRVAVAGYGFEPSYARVIAGLIASGSQGWQLALLAPGWVHGCLGLWLSLRHRQAARRLRPLLLALLLGVPVLAAAGFVQMSRTVAESAPIADGRAPGSLAALAQWRQALLGIYALLVLGAIGASRWRAAAGLVKTGE